MREGAPGATRRRSSGWISVLRISAILLAVLLVLVTLSVGYLLFYPNALKPVAVFAVDRLLGRQLLIDGNLTVELSRTPLITVSRFRFSNPPGSAEPWMVTADHTDARIDLTDLLENRFRLMELTVHGARVNLLDTVEGSPNWAFFEADEDEEDEEGEGNWSFMLERLSVTESVLDLRLGELEPILLTIPTLAQSTDPQGHLALDGNGLINGDTWRIDGQVGPLAEILAAGRIEVDVDLMIDEAQVDASGSIGNLATLSELDLTMSLRGPDGDLLGRIFRLPESFRGDIQLTGSIRPETVGHRIDAKGHISQFHIETSGTVADLAGLDGWDGSVALRGPDAGVFGKALQIQGFPEGPFQVQGTVHVHGGDLDLQNVVVDTDTMQLRLNADFVQFPHREGALVSLSLTGDDLSAFRQLLRLPDLPAMPFDLDLALDAKKAEVLTSSLSIGKNTLTARGFVGEYPDFHGTDLNLTVSGEEISHVFQSLGLTLPFTGRYDAAGRLTLAADGLALHQSRAQLPGHRLQGDVVWPDPLKPASLEYRGSLELADLSQTGGLFGASGLPAVPVTGNGVLRVREGNFDLRESRIRLGSVDIDAKGVIGQPGVLSDLDLTIDASGPSLDALFDDALPPEGGAIPFSAAARIQGTEGALRFPSFRLQASGGTFEAKGTLSLSEGLIGSEFSLNGRGSNLSELIPAFPEYRPPAAPWHMEAAVALPDSNHLEIKNGILEIGSVSVQVDGVLDSMDHTRTRLRASAEGDRISDIGQIGDVAWPEHPFDLAAELHGSLNAIEIRSLQAHWGNSDLSGSGRVLLGERPFVEVRGRSTLLDVYDLQQALFGAAVDEEPEDDASSVFPDIPISLDFIAGIDGLLDVQIGQYRGVQARLEDVELDLHAEDGVLQVDRVALRDEAGYFQAAALLRPRDGKVDLELQLKGEDADLGLFVSDRQTPGSPPRYTIDVDIWGSGHTVAELAGGLNGKLLVSSDGGQISNQLIQTFAGDFVTNVLGILNPFIADQDVTRMDCLVLNSVLRNGRLRLTPGFVMRTARLNMFVYGSVNLADETLDLSLATQARQGIGISAATITNPFFKVGGTLASPALQLDPANAAIAASVATATVGLSIVVRGIWERLRGTQNPCPQFLEFEQTLPERPAAFNPPPEAEG